MFLNFDKIGVPLCKVIGGKYNNKIIYTTTNDEEDEKITKSFKKLILTDGGKFQQIANVQNNRVMYITGASGSGKSTLLYIISTLDFPSYGTVKIDGRDISKMSSEELHHFRFR